MNKTSFDDSSVNSYNHAGVDYPGALEDVCNLSGVPEVTCEVLCSHGTADIYTINKSYNQMLAFCIMKYHLSIFQQLF